MISWDEPKRQRNLQAHGIDFADLEPFFDGDLLTREDRRADYGERRFQTIGVLFGVALRRLDAARIRRGPGAPDLGAKGGKT